MDAINLKKKVQYLEPVAICEFLHARPRWMKHDNVFLKPFKMRMKKKQRTKFPRDHEEGYDLHIAYDDTMGRYRCHI